MKYGKLLIGLVILTILISCDLAPFEEGKNPVFLAKNIGLDDTGLEYWK